jgi:uncharacterized phage protein (TIGR01671 family)
MSTIRNVSVMMANLKYQSQIFFREDKMQRERKFRMWLPCEKRMVYRNLTDRNWYYHETESQLAFRAMPNDEHRQIMQFIKIRDKNEKRIYEDDIVSDKYGDIRVINSPEWFQCDAFDCFGYEAISGELTAINSETGFYLLSGKRFLSSFEVIGNIHESPELLTITE